jgi:hypothetical protein
VYAYTFMNRNWTRPSTSSSLKINAAGVIVNGTIAPVSDPF